MKYLNKSIPVLCYQEKNLKLGSTHPSQHDSLEPILGLLFANADFLR
ncbi:hypothetical protein [Bartonella henselae]|nr:hypothetical protein [Bartonella henselae]